MAVIVWIEEPHRHVATIQAGHPVLEKAGSWKMGQVLLLPSPCLVSAHVFPRMSRPLRTEFPSWKGSGSPGTSTEPKRISRLSRWIDRTVPPSLLPPLRAISTLACTGRPNADLYQRHGRRMRLHSLHVTGVKTGSGLAFFLHPAWLPRISRPLRTEFPCWKGSCSPERRRRACIRQAVGGAG